MIKQWTPAWAPDAAILSCAADYSRKGQASDAWRFQVYSAARGQIVATRIQGTEVIVLHETTALFRQQPMPLDEWTLDSDEAIRIWWDNGGQAAWNRPDSGVLHARLGPNKEHRLVWQMTVTYGVNDALGFWEIAARDGAVLSQNVGGGNE
jgi:hypothetical protein